MKCTLLAHFLLINPYRKQNIGQLIRWSIVVTKSLKVPRKDYRSDVLCL